jgi:hypothetical protein
VGDKWHPSRVQHAAAGETEIRDLAEDRLLVPVTHSDMADRPVLVTGPYEVNRP